MAERDYESELAQEQLYNSMKIADTISFPHSLMTIISRDCFIGNRTFAIEWMKKVMGRECDEVRDTSIRIFDAYLAVSYYEDPRVIRDTCRLAFAAAASMILSSKLLCTKQPISSSWFTAFNTEDIAFFEKQVIMKAGSRISPLCSPSSYLHYAIGLCEGITDCEKLMKIANLLIGEFWEESSSLLYAPSTIAISAVIVALSVMNVNCEAFLNNIPDYFFPGYGKDFFLDTEDRKSLFLDCDACVKALEKVPSMRTTSNTRSPSSIADTDNIHSFTSVSMDAFQK